MSNDNGMCFIKVFNALPSSGGAMQPEYDRSQAGDLRPSGWLAVSMLMQRAKQMATH